MTEKVGVLAELPPRLEARGIEKHPERIDRGRAFDDEAHVRVNRVANDNRSARIPEVHVAERPGLSSGKIRMKLPVLASTVTRLK
jgi:hypothetical protein